MGAVHEAGFVWHVVFVGEERLVLLDDLRWFVGDVVNPGVPGGCVSSWFRSINHTSESSYQLGGIVVDSLSFVSA